MLGGDVFGGAVFAGMEPPALNLKNAARLHIPITHPKMKMDLAVEIWPSLCTIEIVRQGAAASGQLLTSEGDPILVFTDIPCRLGPIDEGHPTDSEHREPPLRESYARRTLKLSDYYPSIVPRQMRAVVDGVTYMIRGNEEDSEHVYTRLYLELIKPRQLV